MLDKSFSTVKIKKAVYIPSNESLYLQFEENVIAGYDTKEYVNVDRTTAREFKNADDRDNFYRTEIKGHFKFRYVHCSEFEIYLSKNPKPVKTYAEYKADFDELQKLKDDAAFNALNK